MGSEFGILLSLLSLLLFINTLRITWFSSNMVSACMYYARQFMERLLKIQIFMNFYSICLLSVHFSSSVFTKPSSALLSCLKTRFCTNTLCNIINLQNFKSVCFKNVHFLLYKNWLIHLEKSKNGIICIASLNSYKADNTQMQYRSSQLYSDHLCGHWKKLSCHFPYLRFFLWFFHNSILAKFSTSLTSL